MAYDLVVDNSTRHRFGDGSIEVDSGRSPKVATAEPGSRLGTAPITFSIKLDGIATGRYDCQASILDPTENKVAFWVSPIYGRPLKIGCFWHAASKNAESKLILAGTAA